MQTQLDIIAELQDSAKEFEDALRAFDDQTARSKPAPERWSVLECVEHVVAAEKRMVGRIREAPRSGGPAPDAARETQLVQGVRDRSTRMSAPQPVLPSGRYATIQEALAAFQSERFETIGVVRDNAAGLDTMLISHPFFGAVNGREAVLLIANHTRRHASQIGECKAAASTADSRSI